MVVSFLVLHLTVSKMRTHSAQCSSETRLSALSTKLFGSPPFFTVPFWCHCKSLSVFIKDLALCLPLEVRCSPCWAAVLFVCSHSCLPTGLQRKLRCQAQRCLLFLGQRRKTGEGCTGREHQEVVSPCTVISASSVFSEFILLFRKDSQLLFCRVICHLDQISAIEILFL